MLHLVTQSCPALCDPMDCTEYWPFPSPGDLPNPGIKSRSPTLQADSLPAEPQGKPAHKGRTFFVIVLSTLTTAFLRDNKVDLRESKLPRMTQPLSRGAGIWAPFEFKFLA